VSPYGIQPSKSQHRAFHISLTAIRTVSFVTVWVASCGLRQWWRTPLIPALGRQRQADFWVWGQPGLQSEFQDSQGYTEKTCLEKWKEKKKNSRGDPCAEIKRWSQMGRVIWTRLLVTLLLYCFSWHWSICFSGGGGQGRGNWKMSLIISLTANNPHTVI
jgi:hypothetical protein